MRHGDRPGGQLDGLERRALARMRHVDDHAEAVHLGDDLASHPGDSIVLAFIAARGQQTLVVVGELHKANAKRMADFHQADIVLDRRAILQAEIHSDAAFRLRPPDIRAGPAMKHQVTICREQLVPADDVDDGLLEILVIGDRHVDGIDTACFQVAKDRFRISAVLKTIDHDTTLLVLDLGHEPRSGMCRCFGNSCCMRRSMTGRIARRIILPDQIMVTLNRPHRGDVLADAARPGEVFCDPSDRPGIRPSGRS